jgi:hypothetical protein
MFEEIWQQFTNWFEEFLTRDLLPVAEAGATGFVSPAQQIRFSAQQIRFFASLPNYVTDFDLKNNEGTQWTHLSRFL